MKFNGPGDCNLFCVIVLYKTRIFRLGKLEVASKSLASPSGKPVIQQEATGCAIASSATLAGVSYAAAKKFANNLGIAAADSTLWSSTTHIRKLLKHYNIIAHPTETPFKNWCSLPGRALLDIKWHKEKDKPYWHWVVFVRDASGEYVLDSKKALTKNVRPDFGRIKPKWFIEARDSASPVRESKQIL